MIAQLLLKKCITFASVSGEGGGHICMIAQLLLKKCITFRTSFAPFFS